MKNKQWGFLAREVKQAGKLRSITIKSKRKRVGKYGKIYCPSI